MTTQREPVRRYGVRRFDMHWWGDKCAGHKCEPVYTAACFEAQTAAHDKLVGELMKYVAHHVGCDVYKQMPMEVGKTYCSLDLIEWSAIQVCTCGLDALRKSLEPKESTS